MTQPHCHGSSATAAIPTQAKRVVLVGNPNVGKSAVFHGLTGVYVEVSNYPGTTVDIASGRMGDVGIFDTPGVYGVSAFNEEERVARDMILQADAIINVVDAAHLDRDLFLTLQIIDMGFPVVVALNLMDEARANGMEIDVTRLSAELGVEVIPTVAVRGEGIAELKAAVARVRRGIPTPEVAERMPGDLPPADAVMWLEDDPAICERLGRPGPGLREEMYRARRRRADEIAERVVRETSSGASLSTRLGRLTLHPLGGLLVLAGFLYLMYQVLGVWVAQDVVGITEEVWMGEYYVPWITALVGRFVQPESFLGEILIGEFGLLTMTVSYLLGLLLPLVLGFYLFLSVAEDSGYLPRIAVLVDRLMTKVGLNGRAIIPTILGFGCVTMATVTTRLMGTQRERTIATFLLSLAIPCSAQLAVITVMLAPLGPVYIATFIVLLLLVYGVTGMLLNRVLPGSSSDLLIDLPPLRLPRIKNVLQKTYLKTKGFISEAWMFFAGGALLISILQQTGVLAAMEGGLAPVTEGWLGLPRAAAQAFIMGFVRRDFGAAGLYDMALTPHQTIVAVVTITLFTPCIASILIMFKERGRRQGAAMWLGDVALAILLGGIFHRVLIW
ncbi:ferrous iron transport protein B [Symbiobacterium terraclitae]|uniref:ferrous iron transport protein B n=1 Tax=Symbiobacterium terraclitae TaxID=557451 RepID=UPI0035B557F1